MDEWYNSTHFLIQTRVAPYNHLQYYWKHEIYLLSPSFENQYSQFLYFYNVIVIMKLEHDTFKIILNNFQDRNHVYPYSVCLFTHIVCACAWQSTSPFGVSESWGGCSLTLDRDRSTPRICRYLYYFKYIPPAPPVSTIFLGLSSSLFRLTPVIISRSSCYPFSCV